MPLVAMQISDRAEPRFLGGHIADEHLAADDEEYVGQTVESLDQHDPKTAFADDVGCEQNGPTQGANGEGPCVSALIDSQTSKRMVAAA